MTGKNLSQFPEQVSFFIKKKRNKIFIHLKMKTVSFENGKKFVTDTFLVEFSFESVKNTNFA